MATIPNCTYTSQDFVLSFFLDETTYPDQAGIIIQFLTAVSNVSNPAGSERDAYVYNIATGSQYISKKLGFDNLVSEYISQGVNSTGVTTLSLEYALTFYQKSGPTPSIATTIAPTIIMVTSKNITDLDQTKSTIGNLRQDRTAYIVSVTLSSDATNQLSNVGFDLRIDLTNATQNSAQDAVDSIINMICSKGVQVGILAIYGDDEGFALVISNFNGITDYNSLKNALANGYPSDASISGTGQSALTSALKLVMAPQFKGAGYRNTTQNHLIVYITTTSTPIQPSIDQASLILSSGDYKIVAISYQGDGSNLNNLQQLVGNNAGCVLTSSNQGDYTGAFAQSFADKIFNANSNEGNYC
ncbi:hypothetical protein FO519_007176 [Halicephalobus sp. NKZ332]|nr:hypothetical protein FO519_007176 [Halicephalobus sp. NKZ332]